MAGAVGKSFDSPDEVRSPEKTEVAVIDLGGAKAARFTLQPGWSWESCIKPVAGTESCQASHTGVVTAGRMQVTHDDGTEVEIGPGDAYRIAPGHNARIVSDEPFVGFEFETTTVETYAKG